MLVAWAPHFKNLHLNLWDAPVQVVHLELGPPTLGAGVVSMGRAVRPLGRLPVPGRDSVNISRTGHNPPSPPSLWSTCGCSVGTGKQRL